ncbi:MAG: (2Fe-2S) ferredoxin domain-containing protein [Planctomycetota bacterium]
MPKLTPDDLAKIRQRLSKSMNLREGAVRAKITVHMGTCGIAAGSRGIMKVLMDLLDAREEQDIVLSTSGCAGLCSREPMMTVELEGRPPVKYVDLDEAKASRIFREHVLAGNVVEDCALALGSERMG